MLHNTEWVLEWGNAFILEEKHLFKKGVTLQLNEIIKKEAGWKWLV